MKLTDTQTAQLAGAGEGGPGEIEVDFDPFNGNFCIFEEREENNDRGLQMDGQKEEERV